MKLYRVDELEISPEQREIRRNDEPLRLRPIAFDLLAYLIRHRDRILTKEELLDRVWKGTSVTESSLLQCVSELRRALDDDARQPRFIRTVAKAGYRFVGPVQEVIADDAAPEVAAIIQPDPIPAASHARSSRAVRWLVASAVAFGPVILAAVWWGMPLPAGLPTAQAKRTVTPEPEWWESGWWKLNEGTGSQIRDSVHGLTAAVPAGVSWVGGVSGAALLFPGPDLVVRGKDPGVLPGVGPRTLMAWIKTATTNGDSTAIFAAGESTSDVSNVAEFHLTLHQGGTAGFGEGHYELLGQQRVDDNRWHQVSGVFEGTENKTMRLFVDGAEQANSGLGPARLSPIRESQWTVGRGFQSGTSFRGAIDDVRIFERALRSDEIRSLYRCVAGMRDVDVEGGGSYYFAPIFGDHAGILPRRAGDSSSGAKNTGKDYGGIMFVRREPDCGLRSVHGADVGQDLNIVVELSVPGGPGGAVTDGGPYFRSRRAHPGDGIIGGTSAGFWVHLDSTGQVRVERLHPHAVLAFSDPPEGFDSGAFHRLETAVRGDTLEVSLDGRVLVFDQTGQRRNRVRISPVWETAIPKGRNEGSAGIAFSCTRNRGQAGGQQARNILVRPYRSLTDRVY